MSKAIPIVIAVAVLATMAGLYMVSKSQNEFLKFPSYDSIWTHWKELFQKTYPSLEDGYRKAIFL